MERLVITCIAKDSDGDKLSYDWSASGGQITPQGNQAIWIAPSRSGSYTIKVTVDDGKGDTAKGSCVVNVLRTLR